MRIRKIVNGTPEQPRMTVFRSNKQIYVQFIDDLAGVTLATASSLDKEVAAEAAGKTKCEVAALVGKLAAQRAIEKGIETVAFDRNGYLYHGREKCWQTLLVRVALNSKRYVKYKCKESSYKRP